MGLSGEGEDIRVLAKHGFNSHRLHQGCKLTVGVIMGFSVS